MAYECPEGDYESDDPESVAGHMLSVHGINDFDDLSEVQEESMADEVVDRIREML